MHIPICSVLYEFPDPQKIWNPDTGTGYILVYGSLLYKRYKKSRTNLILDKNKLNLNPDPYFNAF